MLGSCTVGENVLAEFNCDVSLYIRGETADDEQ